MAEKSPLLIAVPNVSEGRDRDVLERLEQSVVHARVLDVHVDPDHNRAVFTLAGRQGELSEGLVGLAKAAVEHIDLRSHDGVHPHVGALDVMPVVWLDRERRGAAGGRGADGGRASSARTPGCRCSSTGTWPPGPSTPSAPGCAAAARPGWPSGSSPAS